MIVAVTLQYHDYEQRIQYVDTAKLSADNYVDSELLKAIQAGKDYCGIDASDWENEPDKFPNDNIGVSSAAVLEEKPKAFDYAIMLTIRFE